MLCATRIATARPARGCRAKAWPAGAPEHYGDCCKRCKPCGRSAYNAPGATWARGCHAKSSAFPSPQGCALVRFTRMDGRAGALRLEHEEPRSISAGRGGHSVGSWPFGIAVPFCSWCWGPRPAAARARPARECQGHALRPAQGVAFGAGLHWVQQQLQGGDPEQTRLNPRTQSRGRANFFTAADGAPAG